MRTELDCLPCFFGQVSRTLAHAGVTGERSVNISRQASAVIEAAAMADVPARTSTIIHRLIRRETGVDPYHEIKVRYNQIALGKMGVLRQRVAAMVDPLEGAVRAAIAGNIIDFGIYDSVDLDKAIEESFLLPLSADQFGQFARAIEQARSILYLCDNAGEIVFDRILIETLCNRGKHMTAVVKGSAVINDATREDAEAAGLAECARVIDNGSDGIGTLLESCSPHFREAYGRADVIISKGQANYETLLAEKDARTFFLFKVKCDVVARSLDRPNGSIVLLRGGA